MILGTRGSALALAQTNMVLQALQTAHPAHTFCHQVIHTTGDLLPNLRLGSPDSGADKGVWTKELEAALANGTVQVAVHSAKDVPTDLPHGFHLVGCLARAAIEDVLVSRHPGGIDGLPPGSTIATSSVRRTCQIHHHRPDLNVVEIRGNVPTRLHKLADTHDLDAIVLARAGLDRLGYATPWISPASNANPLPPGLFPSLLPCSHFLPAAAQGIVAFEVFGDNPTRDAALHAITDPTTWRALRAERAFLRLLQAGCHTPIGLLTREQNHTLHMLAIVFPHDIPFTTPPLTARALGPAENPEAVAAKLFASLHKT